MLSVLQLVQEKYKQFKKSNSAPSLKQVMAQYKLISVQVVASMMRMPRGETAVWESFLGTLFAILCPFLAKLKNCLLSLWVQALANDQHNMDMKSAPIILRYAELHNHVLGSLFALQQLQALVTLELHTDTMLQYVAESRCIKYYHQKSFAECETKEAPILEPIFAVMCESKRRARNKEQTRAKYFKFVRERLEDVSVPLYATENNNTNLQIDMERGQMMQLVRQAWKKNDVKQLVDIVSEKLDIGTCQLMANMWYDHVHMHCAKNCQYSLLITSETYLQLVSVHSNVIPSLQLLYAEFVEQVHVCATARFATMCQEYWQEHFYNTKLSNADINLVNHSFANLLQPAQKTLDGDTRLLSSFAEAYVYTFVDAHNHLKMRIKRKRRYELHLIAARDITHIRHLFTMSQIPYHESLLDAALVLISKENHRSNEHSLLLACLRGGASKSIVPIVARNSVLPIADNTDNTASSSVVTTVPSSSNKVVPT